jgi:hypothetical protein
VEQVMIAIQAPLKNGNSGPAVANLQAALLAFVQKGVIKALSAPKHPTADELKALAETMRTAETPRSTFGDATTALVAPWFIRLDSVFPFNLATSS